MRALIQRVTQAQVEQKGVNLGSIKRGLLVYIGIGNLDTETSAQRLWSKIVSLRVFADSTGKTNYSLSDVKGEVLIVSQFTLYANCKRGKRPSFIQAAPPDQAKYLYECFVGFAKAECPRVETGSFGAAMEVTSINDGPFTLWLDTDEL